MVAPNGQLSIVFNQLVWVLSSGGGLGEIYIWKKYAFWVIDPPREGFPSGNNSELSRFGFHISFDIVFHSLSFFLWIWNYEMQILQH